MILTAEVVEKHPFYRQLHTTHVVAVGWEQHGCSPTVAVWGGGSAFLPIGVPVNLSQLLMSPNKDEIAAASMIFIITPVILLAEIKDYGDAFEGFRRK